MVVGRCASDSGEDVEVAEGCWVEEEEDDDDDEDESDGAEGARCGNAAWKSASSLEAAVGGIDVALGGDVEGGLDCESWLGLDVDHQPMVRCLC